MIFDIIFEFGVKKKWWCQGNYYWQRCEFNIEIDDRVEEGKKEKKKRIRVMKKKE